MSMMRVIFQNAAKLANQSSRQLSTSAARAGKNEIEPGYFKLKDIQARFQKNDGLPIHLKGGAMDKAMYYFTFALSAAGIAGAAELYYQIIFKR